MILRGITVDTECIFNSEPLGRGKMDKEREKDREPVPVPIRREKPVPEKKVAKELPEYTDIDIPVMPRRWYIY